MALERKTKTKEFKSVRPALPGHAFPDTPVANSMFLGQTPANE